MGEKTVVEDDRRESYGCGREEGSKKESLETRAEAQSVKIQKPRRSARLQGKVFKKERNECDVQTLLKH